MSNSHLPAELLDYVVDFLRDTKYALSNCCLVSKSWVPRARQHLFAHIEFGIGADIESWKKTFPDPSTSPAHYAKTLLIDCLHVVTPADAEAGGWITGFSRVVNLVLSGDGMDDDEPGIFFIPLQRLSPAVKYLSVHCVPPSSPHIFDLILSFPLLEDLAMTNVNYAAIDEDDGSNGLPTTNQPSNMPAFTGSFSLITAGPAPIARQLSSLPGGIHFRKLTLTWSSRGADISLIAALVKGCSHTLESLEICCDPFSAPILFPRHTDNLLLFQVGPATIDLSKAIKLQDVIFRPDFPSVKWITAALQTTTPKHRELQKITIRVPYSSTFPDNVDTVERSTTFGEWMDLDRLLVQFWESRSTHPKVECTTWQGWNGSMRGFFDCFLPELTRRGTIDANNLYLPM